MGYQTHKRIWKKLKSVFLSERSQSGKGYILYDSKFMTFWERHNYGNI